jgi:FkbM family methyltransferase
MGNSHASSLAGLARHLPPGLLRFVGRLQFASPLLRRAIRRASRSLREGESTMAHGIGAGLRFDPSGAHPGYALGTSEPEIQGLLAELLRPGAVFYDIGANVGFFTVLGARLVGPGGRVVAFEPLPSAAAALRRNVEANSFSTVDVLEAAVDDRGGRATFHLPSSERSTGGRLDGHAIRERGRETQVDVRVVAIDELVASGELPPPDAVKIDVEGAELRALEGMRDTLTRHRPLLVCETHGTRRAVTEALRGWGYATETVEGEDEDAWNGHVVARPAGSAP